MRPGTEDCCGLHSADALEFCLQQRDWAEGDFQQLTQRTVERRGRVRLQEAGVADSTLGENAGIEQLGGLPVGSRA